MEINNMDEFKNAFPLPVKPDFLTKEAEAAYDNLIAHCGTILGHTLWVIIGDQLDLNRELERTKWWQLRKRHTIKKSLAMLEEEYELMMHVSGAEGY